MHCQYTVDSSTVRGNKPACQRMDDKCFIQYVGVWVVDTVSCLRPSKSKMWGVSFQNRGSRSHHILNGKEHPDLGKHKMAKYLGAIYLYIFLFLRERERESLLRDRVKLSLCVITTLNSS